jgi:aminopeptidase N
VRKSVRSVLSFRLCVPYLKLLTAARIIAEAKKRFQAYTTGNDTSTIHPSLRTAVFRIAIKEGGAEEYEAVKHYFHTTTSTDGKEIALQSMGRVQTAQLARDFLDFMFSPAVAVQDIHSAATSLAQNSKTRGPLWEYIKERWDNKVFPTLSGNMVVLERFLKCSLNRFASFEVERDIQKFFEGKDKRGYDRGLGVIVDTITAAAKYKERDAALVREWLRTYGYL